MAKYRPKIKNSPYELIASKTEINDGCTRYALKNGDFIDVATVIAHRSYGYKAALWRPGAGEERQTPNGSFRIAGFILGGDSLRDILARIGD